MDFFAVSYEHCFASKAKLTQIVLQFEKSNKNWQNLSRSHEYQPECMSQSYFSILNKIIFSSVV